MLDISQVSDVSKYTLIIKNSKILYERTCSPQTQGLLPSVSSKCEVGYDYKVFNTATGAAQALTICRAHGATIANPAQFKKIKNPPK